MATSFISGMMTQKQIIKKQGCGSCCTQRERSRARQNRRGSVQGWINWTDIERRFRQRLCVRWSNQQRWRACTGSPE